MPEQRELLYHTHLPCRCGADRNDSDVGSGRCAKCRYPLGEYTTSELLAAFQRCIRSDAGRSPRVAWVVERLPGHPIVWMTCPPAKEGGQRVLLVPLDE